MWTENESYFEFEFTFELTLIWLWLFFFQLKLRVYLILNWAGNYGGKLVEFELDSYFEIMLRLESWGRPATMWNFSQCKHCSFFPARSWTISFVRLFWWHMETKKTIISLQFQDGIYWLDSKGLCSAPQTAAKRKYKKKAEEDLQRHDCLHFFFKFAMHIRNQTTTMASFAKTAWCCSFGKLWKPKKNSSKSHFPALKRIIFARQFGIKTTARSKFAGVVF